MLGNTVNQKAGFASDGVTVCVPGAVLAAAPAAEAPPVFVDDSGTRRKLIRVTGGLISLVLIGFLGLVGVALAVPSVGATVGLGDVTPFLVPGAAAKPPAPVAVVKKRVQTVAPVRRSTPKPAPTTAPAPTKEAPVVIAPPTESAAPTTAPPTTAPPTTAPPTTVPPTSAPPVVNPPKSDAPVVDPAPQGGTAPILTAPIQAAPVLASQNG